MNGHEKQLPRSFWFLNGAQFLGAFNDNLFKLLLIFQLLALYGQEKLMEVSSLAGALFVIPFLLFSPFAGRVADKFNKKRIIDIVKISEILIMVGGFISFLYESPVGLYTTLFFMSTQSCFMGPAKLGILPEMISKNNLPRANGYQLMGAYSAVVIGTGCAALLSTAFSGNLLYASAGCIVIAIIGFFFSLAVSDETSRQKSNTSSIKLRTVIQSIKENSFLKKSIMGSSLFLFIGAFIQISIIPFGMEVLNFSRENSSYLFLLSAIGIGLGSVLTGKLSQKHPEQGFLTLGSIGMTISTFALYTFSTSLYGVMIAVFMIGFFGGFFIVPINTLLQTKSPEQMRGSILAVSYFFEFIGVLGAAVATYLLDTLNISLPNYYLFLSLISFILIIITFPLGGHSFLKIVGRFILSFRYKLETINNEEIPQQEGALLVFNHVSWLDGIIAALSTDRKVHFLMKRQYYNHFLIKPFVNILGLIPIDHGDSPKELYRSLQKAQQLLNEGEIIGIFPEGTITLDGFTGVFQKGYKVIVKNTDVPIIPVGLSGLWGSRFSYQKETLNTKKSLFTKREITIRFGTAQPNTISPFNLKTRVDELLATTAQSPKIADTTLDTLFIQQCRSQWNSNAVKDSTGKKLSYGKLLIASEILKSKLSPYIQNSNYGCVMLPASAGGVIVNTTLTLMGKTAVNINFTGSTKVIESALNQCSSEYLITSKLFLHKLKRNDIPGNIIFLEDLLKTVTSWDKIKAMGKAISKLFISSKVNRPDSEAAIIFSSGSTAEPKGVVLTHKNIIENLTSIRQAISLTNNDKICASLPLFHSFGYTASMWLPLVSGMSVAYHPNPLDGKVIASIVNEEKSTILFATPTFLRSYMRSASKEDFTSLHYVITGAEKLRPELAEKFYQKFNLRPLEGYGATELSPVATLNIHQKKNAPIGNKTGTIGRPLPQIACKVIDIDTQDELSEDQSGLIFFKGGNVMKEYLNNKSKTDEVLNDGWYSTGDIGKIDSDGFITLTDRLSRFCKIGGEMIPFGAVEDIYMRSLLLEGNSVVVTSIDDSIKGESLAVLYNKNEVSLEQLTEAINNAPLPNLWKPRLSNYFPIDEIPLLGTGKLDLQGIKRYAQEMYSLQVKAA